MHEMEEGAKAAATHRIREIKEEARRNAEREAKEIISLAIQRIAATTRPRPPSPSSPCRRTR
jgi:ribonuclease Y